MAINASIRFQFEFLQTEWINNGEFADLSRDEVDPFVGERRPRSRFRIPDPRGAPRNIFDLPAFVTLRGGGYYFVPSVSAMRFMAAPPPLVPRSLCEDGLGHQRMDPLGSINDLRDHQIHDRT